MFFLSQIYNLTSHCTTSPHIAPSHHTLRYLTTHCATSPHIALPHHTLHHLTTHCATSYLDPLLQENCEFSVRASYMEIYNEEIVDLLGADNIENPRLRIYEDKKVTYDL